MEEVDQAIYVVGCVLKDRVANGKVDAEYDLNCFEDMVTHIKNLESSNKVALRRNSRLYGLLENYLDGEE